jgi:hypothetical protein
VSEGEQKGIRLDEAMPRGDKADSATHVEATPHGRCGGVAARGERGDEATRALG